MDSREGCDGGDEVYPHRGLAIIYADASWNPWTGRGGVAWRVKLGSKKNHGSLPIMHCHRIHTPNGKGYNADISALEAFAVLCGVRAAKQLGARAFWIHTDNQVVMLALRGRPVSVRPQVEKMIRAVRKMIGSSKVGYHWVKAHSGKTTHEHQNHLTDLAAKKARWEGERIGPHPETYRLRQEAGPRRK